jgi:hypothetical protein
MHGAGDQIKRRRGVERRQVRRHPRPEPEDRNERQVQWMPAPGERARRTGKAIGIQRRALSLGFGLGSLAATPDQKVLRARDAEDADLACRRDEAEQRRQLP